MRLAVTGATGFVGGHLLDAAAKAGHQVAALARRPQPPRNRVEWIAGSLDDRAALDRLVEGADAVIHVAGVVNAPDAAGFEARNVLGTGAILSAAEKAGIARFVHVSSLAAREPRLSQYGASKARSEALVAAFRATLEEIGDSDLLVHVVDASNPRVTQQIESAEKILNDLKLNEIPRLIVLNKADLLDEIDTESLKRQLSLDKQSESVAISAIKPETLPPLLKEIGEVLAKDLNNVSVFGLGT